ncbi:MAG: nucleotidyltransferase domain-containing protein [Monoglobales bacterium]
MCTQSELSKILKEIAHIYHMVYGDDVIKIILYGSYARGDFNSDSDVDIVALVRGSRAELQNQLKKVWDASSDLELEYGTILSPTVIPYDEYVKYQSDLPYYRNIAEEGVEVVA